MDSIRWITCYHKGQSLTFLLFSSCYSDCVTNKKTGPPNPDNLPEDGKLKSEMMTKDNRRYYLDLKENSRGRFLRVSFKTACISFAYRMIKQPDDVNGKRKPQYPESFCLLFIFGLPGVSNDSSRRSSLADRHPCPRNDWISWRTHWLARRIWHRRWRIQRLLFKSFPLVSFSVFQSSWFHHVFFVSLPMTGELPEGRHLRVENKNFYFDIGQNNRGIYMRISEVKIDYLFFFILFCQKSFKN